MNKKFFTLIASAFMLVASLGTANAALTVGDPTGKLDADAQKNGLFELYATRQGDATTKYVVYVDGNGVLKATPYADYNKSIASALWCIKVTPQVDGANPRFDFTSRAFGSELAVGFEDWKANGEINIAYGANKGWKFSPTYASVAVAQAQPLTTYHKNDQVLVLALEAGEENVTVLERTASIDHTYTGGDVLLFTIMNPKPVFMTATDYNTRFLTEENDSIKLTFDKDRHNTKILNPWSDYALQAVPSANGALSFKRADGLFLRVDTAWTNEFGEKFLAFNWGDITKTNIGDGTVFGNIRRQYDFYLEYHFNNDVIDIYAAQALMKHKNAASSDVWTANIDKIRVFDPSDPDYVDNGFLRVKLQDLSTIDEIRLITIGEEPLNTKITLNLPKCTYTESNLTSIANDLYVIKNSKGQTLIVPIYTVNNEADTIPQWVTLPAEVDPYRIPAYQWVVEKTRTSNKEYSPIKITNREHPRIATNHVQLITGKNASLSLPALHRGNTTGLWPDYLTTTVRPEDFTSVDKVDKKIKTDPHLGYFFIDSMKSVTYGYELNYLHKYSDGEFLSINKNVSSDTTLFVSPDKAQFKLDIVEHGYYTQEVNNGITNYLWHYAGLTEKYGYYTDNVPGLEQLVRVQYRLRIPIGSGLLGVTNDRFVVVDKEERFSVTDYSEGDGGIDWPSTPPADNKYYKSRGDRAIFYLKTNNSLVKEGKTVDYYAMLDTRSGQAWTPWPNSQPRTKAPHNTIKVGIDDASLWAYMQVQDEVRTSAFAVSRFTEPLYRRFDGGNYGKDGKVIEPYQGVDKDGNDAKDANAPLWLKFTKYNNLGNEFLFENSPKGVGGNYQGKVDSLLKPTTENEYRQGITDKSISFLGLYNINQFKESGKDFSYTFYVDTAYVRDETPMPQYMLALNPDFVETDTIYKQYRDSIWNSNGEVIDTNVSRIDTIYRTGFTRGFWVFNAQDSVGFSVTYPLNADYPGKFAYGAGETTRLAFVDGIHMEDTFYVLHPQLVPSKYLDAEGKIVTARIDSTFFWEIIPAQDKLYLGDNTHYYPRWHAESWNYDFKDGKYVVKSNAKAYNQERNGKSMVFQFRLVDPANDRRFLIESQRRISYNQDGEAVNPDVEIAPTAGRWLKIQNGVPVMSDVINIITARQNGAEIFDVTKGEVKSAVANEAAPTVSSTIQVIGNVGSATILNAGGKKVAISNILGQTVANQVVSSDNATIALPKGIVVVAVEGEAAVKAIVK